MEIKRKNITISFYCGDIMGKKKDKEPKAKAPNKTLEARFNGRMTKGFTDLRDIVLSVVNQPDDVPENLHYDIYISDYKDKFGLKFDDNVYKKIRNEVTRQMRDDSLLSGFDEDGDPMVFFPFQRISWKANGLMHVVLGEDFKKILVGKGAKTFYSIGDTLQMKSKYSKIMYPRLLEHINQQKIEFKARGSLNGQYYTFYEPIEQFRSICGVPKSYKISHIKDLCETIIAEIEENTDYKAKVFYNSARTPDAKKPVVTHIAWNIAKKPMDEEHVIDADPESYEVETVIPDNQIQGQMDWGKAMTAQEIMTITGLSDKSVQTIMAQADKRGMDSSTLLGICKESMSKPGIDNLAGYIVEAIKRGGFDTPQGTQERTKTRFENFKQRTYDYGVLEEILRKSAEKDDERRRRETQKKKQVFVVRAPEDSEAKYCVVDQEGKLIFSVAKLSEVAAHYKRTDPSGQVEIVRQLDRTYRKEN